MTDNIEDTCQISGAKSAPLCLVERVAQRAVAHLAAPVTGRTVLDLSCGNGTVSRWLASHGAHVTGIDADESNIEAARNVESHDPHGISFLVGDAEDLYMADDSAFDDVVCNLSLAQMPNLACIVAEIARIIRLGGRFIFTVAHPCFDLRLLAEGDACPLNQDYFLEDMREGLDGEIHHRTLASYINAVAARGFTVRRILEPCANEKDVAELPEFSAWCRTPIVLAVEAVFPRL